MSASSSPEGSHPLVSAAPLAITTTPPRRPRTWPAVLTLLLFPGFTAETLTGSTPVLVYLTNPFYFIVLTLLYGSAALLIREVARRRGLGWASILLMGVAFGVFEEGLVVNTWADPGLPQICRAAAGGATVGVCNYGRVAGVSLPFAISSALFHATISIAATILLVELAFRRQAGRPWLGRIAPVALVAAELLVVALGLAGSVQSFRRQALAGPPVAPYVAEGALIIVLVAVALAIKPTTMPVAWLGAPTHPASRPPRLWTLRLVGFLALLVDILLTNGFQTLRAPYPLLLAAYAGLVALAAWRLGTWARRPGWGDEHRLALATGALGFFLLILDPIFELTGTAGGGTTHGTLVVALVYVVFLIRLARRVAPSSPAESSGA